MTTKRYRKVNKNKETTYEDIKDLTLNPMEQYGFGSWLSKNKWFAAIPGIGTAAVGLNELNKATDSGLEKNAGAIGTIGGTVAGSLLGMPQIGGAVGGAIGGAVQNNYQQNLANDIQNQNTQQLQNNQRFANKVNSLNSQNVPMYTPVMEYGGEITTASGNSGPKTSSNLITLSDSDRDLQKKLRNYQGILTNTYADTFKSYVDVENELRNKYNDPYKFDRRKLDTYAQDFINTYGDLALTSEQMRAALGEEAYVDYVNSMNQYLGTEYSTKVGTNMAGAKEDNSNQLRFGPRQIIERYRWSAKDNTSPYKFLENIDASSTNKTMFREGGRIQKPTDPPKISEKTELSYLDNLEYLNNILEEYKNSPNISNNAKNYIGVVRDNLLEELPVSFEDIEDPKNYNEVTYLEDLMNRARPNITRKNINALAQDNSLQTLPQKLSILRNSNIYTSDADSLKKYAPEFYKLHNIKYIKPFLKRRQYGGTLNYGGQLHEGPNGGVPVDAMGNPNSMNPVALVEKGEVSYNTPDGGTYVYSDTLKLNKNKTFAKQAKNIQSRYKFRMKDGVITDSISKKTYDSEMQDLLSKQEELRNFKEMNGEELSNGRDGIYIKPSKRGTFKAQATRMGMGVQEAAGKILSAPEGKYSPEMRRKANFAKNFAKKNGGSLPEYQDGNYLPMINPVPSGVQPVSQEEILKNTGLNYTSPNNIMPTSKLYQGMNWAETGLAAAPSIAGSALGLILESRNKNNLRKLSLGRVSPQQINLGRGRRALRESANLATTNLSRGIRGAAPTSGGYMANMVAGITDIDRNLSNQMSESYTQEELQNAQLRQQADLANMDMAAQEEMYNTQLLNTEDAQRRARINAYISQAGQGITGALSQRFQSQKDADYLNMLNPNYALYSEGTGLNRRRYYRPR